MTRLCDWIGGDWEEKLRGWDGGFGGWIAGYVYENRMNVGTVSSMFAEFETFRWFGTSDILTVSDSRCDSWSVNNLIGLRPGWGK